MCMDEVSSSVCASQETLSASFWSLQYSSLLLEVKLLQPAILTSCLSAMLSDKIGCSPCSVGTIQPFAWIAQVALEAGAQ